MAEIDPILLKLDQLISLSRLKEIAFIVSTDLTLRISKMAEVLKQLRPGAYLLGTGPSTVGIIPLTVDEVVLGRLFTGPVPRRIPARETFVGIPRPTANPHRPVVLLVFLREFPPPNRAAQFLEKVGRYGSGNVLRPPIIPLHPEEGISQPPEGVGGRHPRGTVPIRRLLSFPREILYPSHPLIPLPQEPERILPPAPDFGWGITKGRPKLGLDFQERGIGIEDIPMKDLAPPLLGLAIVHQIPGLLSAPELGQCVDRLPHQKTGGRVLLGLLLEAFYEPFLVRVTGNACIALSPVRIPPLTDGTLPSAAVPVHSTAHSIAPG